jgi:RNA polymerase sigma-70 factor (sigma-E family)
VTSRDEAVEQLLATRGRALTGYAYLLCGDVHEAEDLVQDALVKTFARRRAGVELVSAEAYLRRAICTLYLDRWRSRVRWAGRLPVAAAPEATDSAEIAVADRTDVMRALATLPPQQRAAVVLRYYEDLTVPEVAARMGLGDGTVKRYLSLATHRLEDLLGTLAPPVHDEIVLEA